MFFMKFGSWEVVIFNDIDIVKEVLFRNGFDFLFCLFLYSFIFFSWGDRIVVWFVFGLKYFKNKWVMELVMWVIFDNVKYFLKIVFREMYVLIKSFLNLEESYFDFIYLLKFMVCSL